MEAVKLILMVSGGVLVAAASGSLWWLAPMLAYGAVAVYEHTTPEHERPALLRAGQGRKLLGTIAEDVRSYVADGTLPRYLAAAPAEARPLAQPAPLSTPSAPAQRQRPQVAERPRWVQALNDEPDRAPHALIIGPTGAGKTTMACAALGDRPDRAVVLSPKVNAGNWKGAEVVSLDDDGSYQPIAAAFKDLEQEKRDRIVTLRKRGADALEPLTVVLDETPELVRFVPAAGDFLASMSSIGRELKIRMVVLSTSSRVKDLGIEGRGAALDNFVRVDIDRDRRATISDGIRTVPIPTKDVVNQAKAARLRPWRGEVDHHDAGPTLEAPRVLVTPAPAELPPLDLSDLLADLLGTEVPAAQQQVTVDRGPAQVVVNVSQTSAARPARRRAAAGIDVRARRLRAEYARAAVAGEKFEPTYKRLGGSRNAMHAVFTEHKPK